MGRSHGRTAADWVALVQELGADAIVADGSTVAMARLGMTQAEANKLVFLAAGMRAASQSGALPRSALRPAPSVATLPTTGSKPGGRTHLVIGDAHAKPGQDLRRFAWLGRMVRDLKPDVIVSIGDWACMPSLSSYDKGKRSFEGRRYLLDCDASKEALRLFHREAGAEGYAAERYWTIGNHEQRIERVTQDAPELDGVVGYHHLGFADHGWHTSPFLVPVEVDGVYYAHYYTAQGTGRPLGGVNAARTLVLSQHASVTAGHSHVLSHYAHKGDPLGRRTIHGLVAGCFFEEREHYAGQSNDGWWRGIVVCRDVRDGAYDLEQYGLDRIAREWGSEAERAA